MLAIMAEIHGKISSTGSNISEAMEDLLTSNVFQLLRYFPLEYGLLPILCEAENIDNIKVKFLEEISDATIYFWKRLFRSEPDILIELKQGNKIMANIVIEAKYLSEKTGSADFEDGESYIEGSDQIEREWNDLKVYSCKKKVPYFCLIYLTMDWVKPIETIQESIKAIGDYSKKDIYWLNWQSIHAVLENILIISKHNLSNYEKAVIQDIIELLKKKGLKEFNGYCLSTDNILEPFHYFIPQFFSELPDKVFQAGSLKYFGGD